MVELPTTTSPRGASFRADEGTGEGFGRRVAPARGAWSLQEGEGRTVWAAGRACAWGVSLREGEGRTVWAAGRAWARNVSLREDEARLWHPRRRSMMDVMFLCAGLGTRLRPLTDECPKPLVPVGDRPLIVQLLERARTLGLRSRAVNAHHHAGLLVAALKQYDASIHVSVEDEILGTAGGLARARETLMSDVALVWNGDILAEPEVCPIAASAAASGMALAVAPRRRGEGTVGVDRVGRVVRLRGEVFGVEERGGDYVGILGLTREVRGQLPSHGCLIGDVCLPRLRQNRSVAAVFHHGPWCDIGTLEKYQEANQVWLKAHRGGAQGFGETDGSYVGPSARVGGGVRLVASVVGEGARIDGAGAVESCVIWPGARASAPLRDCVVTTAGRVVRWGA